MLKNPRLLHLFRQAPLHHEGILQQSLTRNFTGQLANVTSRSGPLRRNLATSSQRTCFSNQTQLPRSWRTSGFRFGRQARHNGTKAKAPEVEASTSLTQLTMSERMKAMSKKYGWVVVGIYLGLSALDFPFCFLAVRLFGTERIAAVEHAIISKFWELVETVVPSMKEQREQKQALENAANEATREGGEGGVMDAGKGNGKPEDASIWTQLLLAYGVHKSLIFIRLPITLAITPKVVKTLRKWGWSIGKAK